MKRILKILGVVVGVVVVLMAVAAIALPLVVDPNAHKDRTVALAKDHTGRDLRIEGNIGLSVFPWLGVSLEQAQLGNAPGFENPVFVGLDEMNIRVKLLPLLSRRVEMDTVTVRGLRLNLARDANGHTNWADLTAGKPGDVEGKPERGTDGIALAPLAIGGLDIRDAAVS